MRGFGFLVFAAFVTVSSWAVAISIVPAQLTDEKVEPSCVTTNPSRLSWQPTGWGTSQQGPALQVNNNCEKDVLITDVLVGTSGEKSLTRPTHVEAVVTWKKVEGAVFSYPHYDLDFQTYVFAPDEKNCSLEKVEEFLLSQHRLYLEHLCTLHAADKETCKQNVQSTFEADIKKTNAGKLKRPPYFGLNNREIACKKLTIPPHANARIGLEWGTDYSLVGTISKPEGDIAVHIQGKMVRPANR